MKLTCKTHALTINTLLFSLALTSLIATGAEAGGFDSENVTLKSHISLAEFPSNPSEGNDCWGYVSPSGREYALMGVRNAMAVVEITDPSNPVIIQSISHADTLWGDVKVYQDHCYVVNDFGGGGMDVIDLSDVDNGVVTLVRQFTDGGLSISHNVLIDETSGFLYLAGSNLNGGRLIAYDLSNLANPVFVGQVSSGQGAYSHDAQVVTFTEGPNAGKQIAFSACGGTGLDIYDVTDKSNMFRLSRTTYANLSYAHQVWISDDGQYAYLNDELDGVNQTVIFDVSNLESPTVAGTFNSGVNSTDHNLYFHDGFIYEAEYTAGLRIFDASDPVNPVQVGWFDTYSPNNSEGYAGAWSVYPFFPSGIVLISDRTTGLYVVEPAVQPCDWDIDGSGSVGASDLLSLLGSWGPCKNCPADFNGDGSVGASDLLVLLANWGPCP